MTDSPAIKINVVYVGSCDASGGIDNRVVSFVGHDVEVKEVPVGWSEVTEAAIHNDLAVCVKEWWWGYCAAPSSSTKSMRWIGVGWGLGGVLTCGSSVGISWRGGWDGRWEA